MYVRRLIPKQVFWSGLMGGIFDQKHYASMGTALFLFGWFTTRQTSVNADGEGVVLYGKSMTRAYIAADTGWPQKRIERWIARLVAKNYIRTVPCGNDGQAIFVLRAKDKRKRYHPNATPEMSRVEAGVTTGLGRGHPKNGATSASNMSSRQLFTRDPNTLIPKSPSYYKNPAAVQTAADDCFSSLKTLIREKSVPPIKSDAERDATRRLLLKQAELIREKYPATQKEAALP
jgi:hypothetical protein